VVGANAESCWNRDPTKTGYVCTGVNYTGACAPIAPNTSGNFETDAVCGERVREKLRG
jgi:hypothetical protein